MTEALRHTHHTVTHIGLLHTSYSIFVICLQHHSSHSNQLHIFSFQTVLKFIYSLLHHSRLATNKWKEDFLHLSNHFIFPIHPFINCISQVLAPLSCFFSSLKKKHTTPTLPARFTFPHLPFLFTSFSSLSFALSYLPPLTKPFPFPSLSFPSFPSLLFSLTCSNYTLKVHNLCLLHTPREVSLSLRPDP